MLVHPRAWVVHRVPSPPNVRRYVLERADTHALECAYDVDAGGVRRAP